MIVNFVSLILFIAYILQLIIDSSFENLLAASICFGSGVVGLFITSKLFRGPSLSAIALVGFLASYFWLPLIALTVDVRPLTHNLSYPVDSFLISSIALLVLIVAYAVSINFCKDSTFQSYSVRINSLIKNNITLSTKSFYTIITLALVVRLLTTGLRIFGRLDFLTKIIEPVAIFGALSLACLFYTPASLYIRKYKYNSYPAVVVIFTLLFTLPSLSRFNILIIAANTLILLATKLFYPKNSIHAKNKASKFAINIVLAALLIFPILDRIADATAYVRFSGLAGGGPVETAQKIANAAIIGEKHIWEPTYRGPYPWIDSYTDSTIFRRFISINYLDLSFRYYQLQDNERRALVQEFEISRIVSLAPDPLINLFSTSFDKSPFTRSSFGDYNYYVISGVGLSGFRTGSLLVSLMVLFGSFWPLALFVSSLSVLTTFNLLSFPFIRSSVYGLNQFHVGPITICLMYEALTVFTSAAGGSESLSRIIGLLIRVIPVMAIYFAFFARPHLTTSIQKSSSLLHQ
jgi:hypothetical protein